MREDDSELVLDEVGWFLLKELEVLGGGSVATSFEPLVFQFEGPGLGAGLA